MKTRKRKLRIAAVLFLVLFLTYGLAVAGSFWLRNTELKTSTQSIPSSSAKIATKLPKYSVLELLALTNQEREVPLSLDPVLNATAKAKCQEMAKRNDWSHGDVGHIRLQIGRWGFGENLAYDFGYTEKEVIKGWVDSPTHYQNLVNLDWHRVGFGTCPFRNSTLVVQHFSD